MLKVLFLFFTMQAHAQLTSPFPSEVKHVTIPNAHQVDTNVIRAMAPRSQVEAHQIVKLGIHHVLIFKDFSPQDTSVVSEKALFVNEGWSPNQIRVIPFSWKKTESFRKVCLQTLQALRYIKRHQAQGVYFHCTVGEDRTGYLAGLYDILFLNVKPETAWKQEMCENGYAEGNPQKPEEVVTLIHANITQTFQKMVYKIRQGQIDAKHLENSTCDEDPSLLSSYQADPDFTHCAPSSKYEKPKEKTP